VLTSHSSSAPTTWRPHVAWASGRSLLSTDADALSASDVPFKINAGVSKEIPAAQPANGAARQSASEVLRGMEETQRRSVAALKAMVELLIEKGVFSRDEYLARVKR